MAVLPGERAGRGGGSMVVIMQRGRNQMQVCACVREATKVRERRSKQKQGGEQNVFHLFVSVAFPRRDKCKERQIGHFYAWAAFAL